MYKIIEDYLTKNQYSRPGTKIKKIKGIVVHWVANKMTSAKANRNFFELRKNGKHNYGSAHYIIDLNGSVIIDIPENEVAYHVGAKKYKDAAVKKLGTYPNNCTIGIECTHLDDDGKMSSSTYRTLVELCSDLIKKYKLDPHKDLYRHFDITGKKCHKWFVDNEDKWELFKNKVKDKIEGVFTGEYSVMSQTVMNMMVVYKKFFQQNPDEWDRFKKFIEGE